MNQSCHKLMPVKLFLKIQLYLGYLFFSKLKARFSISTNISII